MCDEDSPRKANDSSALLDDLTEADSHDTECRAGHICSNFRPALSAVHDSMAATALEMQERMPR